jgi:N-acetylglutamate synthase-like GNAT family acetyltransferase
MYSKYGSTEVLSYESTKVPSKVQYVTTCTAVHCTASCTRAEVRKYKVLPYLRTKGLTPALAQRRSHSAHETIVPLNSALIRTLRMFAFAREKPSP